MAVVAPDGFTLGPCVGGLAGRTLVFAGMDSRGRPCALKTLDPAARGVPTAEARFAAEQKRHQQAHGCAHVVPLLETRNDEWMVLAWAHGGDLGALLHDEERATTLTESRVVEIVTALATGVEAIHARGLVHRDIKPSNVLLDGESIWIADFGIAAERSSDGIWRALPEPWIETEIGSPDWAAPELLTNRPITHPANDLFGIGKTWHALATHLQNENKRFVAMRARLLFDEYEKRPTAVELLAGLRG